MEDTVQKVRGGVGGQQWVPMDKNRIAGSNPVEDPYNIRPIGADNGTIARDVELEDALCLAGNGQAVDNLVEAALPEQVNSDPSANNGFDFFFAKRGYDIPGKAQDTDGMVAAGSVKLDPRTTLRNHVSAQMSTAKQGAQFYHGSELRWDYQCCLVLSKFRTMVFQSSELFLPQP